MLHEKLSRGEAGQ